MVSEYATKVIEARALGDDLGGGLLDEYSSDQNDVSVPRTSATCGRSPPIATNKCDRGLLRGGRRDGSREATTTAGHGRHRAPRQRGRSGDAARFFAWLNRLALKSLASTGLDALNKGVHRVAALLQEDPNEEVETKVSKRRRWRYEGLPMAAAPCYGALPEAPRALSLLL